MNSRDGRVIPIRKQRTAIEVLRKANRLSQLRSAMRVRSIGTVAATLGAINIVTAVLRRGATSAINAPPTVRITLDSGAVYTLTLYTVLSIGAVLVGAVVGVVGQWMVRRARRTMRESAAAE